MFVDSGRMLAEIVQMTVEIDQSWSTPTKMLGPNLASTVQMLPTRDNQTNSDQTRSGRVRPNLADDGLNTCVRHY